MKLLTCLIFGLLLLPGTSISEVAYGKALPLAKKANGAPDFRVIFEYELEVIWEFHFRPAFREDLLDLYEKGGVQWNIFDQKSGKNLIGWRNLPERAQGYRSLTIRRRSVLRHLLPRQNRLNIVFKSANSSNSKRYHVDLNKYCEQYISHFVDTTLGKSACQVELPSKWAGQCRNFNRHYKGTVKSGINTCGEAKDLYFVRGCGKFKCPKKKRKK